MIASLRGTVLSVGLTGAVIETGGVGMSIQATPTTLSGLRIGEEVLVHTELVVREDSLTLFGFTDVDERDSFRTLMSAKGVGAKLALAMLAVHTPNMLRRAIASQDVAALTRVPGLGPKGAQRVILDVADKLGPVTGDDADTAMPAAKAIGDKGVETFSEGAQPSADVVAALVQLGWNEASARQAVTAVEADYAEAGENPDMAALLRASLRWLGGGNRG
ncbi:Holliday junction branch migration protein RuvA [Actinomyces sp. oral taxon 170]|jgi:holliday junction DNA helicase ruvA|uniref:Holliday junction branch migration protein RuvA n=1 Tax=Actinomyces sp. oral taxon 170 TaxID=712117 RepID=UPI000205E932|nr:Holliday junction branch migration protein RuvA [Actinomyces sp. oral taxon 170]EGF55589.1 Holliday junction DNA helicase RuvA, N terminal domain protein [Actinomyces sp. oral taxon 170 str. F0386]